jgi:pyruvate dehydrogenase (quinone)
VVDAYTDPNVPPLPPHITLEQARAYASAIMRGDSGSADIIRATVKQIFA